MIELLSCVSPPPFPAADLEAMTAWSKASWIYASPEQIPNPDQVLALFHWATTSSDIWGRFEDWDDFIINGTVATIWDMQDNIIYAHRTVWKRQNPFDSAVNSSSHTSIWFTPGDDQQDDTAENARQPATSEPTSNAGTPAEPEVKVEPPDEQGGQDE